MGHEMTARELREKYPEIPWNEPFKVNVAGLGSGYVCRYCIAKFGLKGTEVATRGGSYEEIQQHIAQTHEGGSDG